ncbi:MAG: CehA/McbA family metallohydrolase [Candidatus Eisenbacteria bacterium]
MAGQGKKTARFLGTLCLAALITTGCGGGGGRPAGLGDGGGRATIEPDGPVVVGSRGTWTVRYVAGDEGVARGGGVVVHCPVFWEWSEPQTVSPGYPGYCTVAVSNRRVRLGVYAHPELHYLSAKVEDGFLSPGDSIRFVYGDTLGGDAPEGRARADSYAERVQEFLVKVDGDGDGVFAEIAESPDLTLVPGPAAALRIYVRAEADLNDSTRVTVAALDRFGNRARGYAGTIRFSHKWDVLDAPISYAFEPEDSGAAAFTVRFTAPGFQTLGVVEEGGTLQSQSNPIRVRPPGDGTPYQVLWGDLHMHSRLSDGTGEPDDLYRYARDVGNLDVAAVTDHDHHGLRPLGAESWKAMEEWAAEFYEPGLLVTLLGYEWTNWVYGHRNVYYGGPSGPLHSTADSATNTPEELWAALEGGSAMTIAHHTGGGPVPTDWSVPPPAEWETLVEISSIHGSSEQIGGLKEIYDPAPGSFVRDALALGYRLGFIGSGDGHVGHPGETESPSGGLAGILAEERTRESVWEALRARRTYATSGERIWLRFRLGEHWMGEEVVGGELPDRLSFHLEAGGTAPIDVAELIGNGTTLDTLFGSEETLEGTLEADNNRSESSYYYVRVLQMDGGIAWSSPIWINP